MSVRKNSLMCLSGGRSLSIASIGRWMDDDSLFADIDVRGKEDEDLGRVRGTSKTSEEGADGVTTIWSRSVSANELSSTARSDLLLTQKNRSLLKSDPKPILDADSIHFRIGSNNLLSRERRNTYDMLPEPRVHTAALFRKRSSSGADKEDSATNLTPSLSAAKLDLLLPPEPFPGLSLDTNFDLSLQSELPDELLVLEVCKHKDVDTKELVRKGLNGLDMGYKPWRVEGSTCGSYYLRDEKGRFAGIFKPEDEEALSLRGHSAYSSCESEQGRWGVRKGVVAGEGAAREVAAYLLDHDSFAKVPATALVRLYSTQFVCDILPHSPKHHRQHRLNSFQRSKSLDASGFTYDESVEGEWKTGSLQEYTSHDSSAEDCGYSAFPVEAVHRIGILDVRVMNTDRHCGNILIRFANDKSVDMIPIDHGLCLPDFLNIENDVVFAWMEYPQAKLPFTTEEIQYIDNLDADRDVCLLHELLGDRINDRSLMTLRVGTLLLKKAVQHNLTLYQIGMIICGQSMTMPLDSKQSETYMPESPLNALIRAAKFESFEDAQCTEYLERLSIEFDNFMEDKSNFILL